MVEISRRQFLGIIPGLLLAFSPFSSEGPLPVIYSGDREKPQVSLTIDDAWQAMQVERALSIARDYGVKMTFFPVGRVLHPQAVLWRQAVEDGHEIGNHTFNHSWLTNLSQAGIEREVNTSQEALNDILGFNYPMRYLRPPGGDGGYNGGNPWVRTVVQNLGYQLTMWSLDSGGATTFAYSDSTPIIRHVANSVRQGDIILFHSNPNDLGALPSIIEYLRGKDIQPVTLSELLS